MTNRDETVGINVAQLRGERSQQWLADEMRARGWKWSQATVWAIEKGDRPLRVLEAVDLVGLFEQQVEYLLASAELRRIRDLARYLAHTITTASHTLDQIVQRVEELRRLSKLCPEPIDADLSQIIEAVVTTLDDSVLSDMSSVNSKLRILLARINDLTAVAI